MTIRFPLIPGVPENQVVYVQIKPADGWYEDGVLVTSYAANGNSNIWVWNPPSKGIILVSGCGGGGGGGSGSSNGASAGAGGGGGSPGVSVLNFPIPVFSGNQLRFTLGAAGNAGSNGGSTYVEHYNLNGGPVGFLYSTGTYGSGWRLRVEGGYAGSTASGGTKGNGGSYILGASASTGDSTYVSNDSREALFWYASGAAGGDPGAAGSTSQTNGSWHGVMSGAAGGAVANGAGGGGAGTPSVFGKAGAGGAGQALGVAGSGWGFGGAGGGGAAANLTNHAAGKAGGAGYLEFWYEMTQ